MNKNIKCLIEYTTLGFNIDDELYTNEPNEVLTPDMVKNYAYCTPKSKEELLKCINTRLEKGIYNLNDIDVSLITDMSDLFNQQDWRIHKKGCIGLTKQQQSQIDISEWDVCNVKDFRAMFYQCEQFNGDITNWNVSNGNCFHHMFSGCKSFNQDIGNWDVSSGTEFFYMFTTCKSFNQDLSKWNINPNADYHKMFNNCKIENRYKPILLQKLK